MIKITWKNAWMGGVVYALGDSIATWLMGDFLYGRMVGMLILGGSLYAWEIPTYFQYLDQRLPGAGWLNALKRMFFSSAFFNPLWVARHLAFIQLFSGQWQSINLGILSIATQSFIYIFPVSLVVNYLIQNKMSLEWRYFSSSLFSAVLAIYFALSYVLFDVTS